MSDIPAVPAAVQVPPIEVPNDRRMFWLAAAIVGMAFVVVGLLFFVPIPPANKDVTETVVGIVMTAGFSGVAGYYFGSSASSKSKDATISKLTNAP